MIDIDDSKTIDREETLKFWSKGFAKINSKVLFDQVDKNKALFNLKNGWNFGELFIILDMKKMKYVQNQII